MWLKIIGWAILIHIILITLSFIEVFIYSILINPGQDQSVYDSHAQLSAPYISIILGIPLFYIVARRMAKKHPGLEIRIAIWLAFSYMVLDFLILIPFQIDWSSHWWIFLLSFGTKLFAAHWGARSVLNRPTIS